jgi:tetratricopeptide (TPR) repeat protein
LIAYEKAVKLNPTDAKAYNNLADVLLRKRLIEEALHSVKKALELDPDMVAAFCTLGEIHQKQGLFKEALKNFQKVFDMGTSDPLLLQYVTDIIDEIQSDLDREDRS